MKILRFIKNNLLGIVIGGVLFGSIASVVALNVASNDVSYTNNKSVKDAIDESYALAGGTFAYWNDDGRFASVKGYSDYSGFTTDGNNYITSNYDTVNEMFYLDIDGSYYSYWGDDYERGDGHTISSLAYPAIALSCSFPKVGASAVSNRAELGKDVYIKTTMDKHNVCIYDNGHEVC